MTLRAALVVGSIGAGLFVGSAAPAVADDLVVAVAAGPLSTVLGEAVVAPFAKAAGVKASVVATNGTIEAARAAHADVAVLDSQTLAAGCKDGRLQKLDWSKLGGRERAVAGSATDCGSGAVLQSTVLAWNRAKFPGTPTWAEFWDVARVPGKRGLRRGARTNLEIALLADGVAPADVYATLRSDGGIDRAFRKLDQLKPYLVWWRTDDEPPRLLESGEVLMTSAVADDILASARAPVADPPTPQAAATTPAPPPAPVAAVPAPAASPAPSGPTTPAGPVGPAAQAVPTAPVGPTAPVAPTIPAGPAVAASPRPDFALQWAGGLTTVQSWAILAGAPASAPALRLLAFAADPKNQHALAAYGGYGGATQGADDGLPAALLATSPSAPANLAAGLPVDETFWRDNGDRLDKMFETWLAK